jgi:hypothetical protein
MRFLQVMPRLFTSNKGKAGYGPRLTTTPPAWRKYGVKVAAKPLLRISLSSDESYDKVHCGRSGIVV